MSSIDFWLKLSVTRAVAVAAAEAAAAAAEEGRAHE